MSAGISSPPPARVRLPAAVSPLTVNRLSIYLRCLRRLQAMRVRTVSSQELAARFDLSASLFRKDLAQLGEFGVRGVGYCVDELAARLSGLLRLDHTHRVVIVGMGDLGRAIARFLGFNDGNFELAGLLDNDPAKVGTTLGSLPIRPVGELATVVNETGAEIGIMAVPAEVAQETYDALVAAGVRSVLNFAPAHLRPCRTVRTKTVDLRIHLEELGFYLGASS
jgi:redox-sensing transcriptional repressor